MDCREIDFFDDSVEVVEKHDGQGMEVESAKPNTFGREEPAIEIFTPAITPAANVGTYTSESNEADGGLILTCCSGGLFDDLSDDEMNIDQSPTDGKPAKGSDDDEKTADTSQLAHDSSSSCASGGNNNKDKDDNVDSSSSEDEELVSRKSNCVSSLQNLMTNLTSKASELDELDTFLVSWQLKSSSSSTNDSNGKNNDEKDDIADNNASKSEDSVIRRRSYVASLQDLTTNQSTKATKLDELDKYLVSWQSRQSACEPSDSRNYNESVEISALNTPPPSTWKLPKSYYESRHHFSSVISRKVREGQEDPSNLKKNDNNKEHKQEETKHETDLEHLIVDGEAIGRCASF